MKILYRPEYNIDLGLLNRLHPFDGCKFEKVFEAISKTGAEDIEAPDSPVDDAVINAFVDPLMRRLIRGKRYVLQALELPYIPLLPFSMIDQRILLPMRWAVAGTIKGAMLALKGESCRNLSGGYTWRGLRVPWESWMVPSSSLSWWQALTYWPAIHWVG